MKENESIIKKVKPIGIYSAHVIVPATWIGKEVKISIIDEVKEDDED